LSLQVADAVATSPGGRGNYVTAIMSDDGTSSWVRLAQYSFRADNSIRQDFWFWDQDTMTGWADTGITTSGCPLDCSVRTAERFQYGDSTYPRTLFGTYSVSENTVSVAWSSGSSESWSLTNQSTASRLALTSSNYGATHGWSWGSTKGFSSYATIAEIMAHGGKYSGPHQENNWGSTSSEPTSLDLSGFTMCNGNCLNLTNTTRKLYLAGPNDSRKTFYNRQTFAADPSSDCIGEGGGHLNPLLQIIDDNGEFRGWVGVEASLYSQQHGSAIVGIYDLNDFDDSEPGDLAGDYNDNGTVDAADYSVWRDNLGQSFELTNENPAAATPGVVDAEDYAFWKSHFGETTDNDSGTGATATVPEPTTLVLLMLAAGRLLRRDFGTGGRIRGQNGCVENRGPEKGTFHACSARHLRLPILTCALDFDRAC
jgi:hypothetical protein